MRTTTKFRQLLKEPGIIQAPGAYDCLTAKIIEKAGFPAVYMTGAGTSVARLGQPDLALATMTERGTINKTAANRLAEALLDRIESPEQLAEELGLLQVQDSAATQAWVDEAFAKNEMAVRDALTSPKKAKKAAGFLRGQVMRISKGQADPILVGRLIEKKLAEAAQE